MKRLRCCATSVLVAGLTAFAADTTTAVPAQVTFSKDIVPILQRSCQNCHQPDGVAPMSLITYKEVRPWAKAIKERTAAARQARRDAALVRREEHRDPAL